MKLVRTLDVKKKIKNTYQIIMDTYWGDSDRNETYKILVKEENIFQVILEAIVLEELFYNGRGGGNDAENVAKHYLIEEGAKHKKFKWLENFPYNHDMEQENTLEYISIFYFDDSQRYKVEKVGFEGFIEEVKKFNEQQKLGEWGTWHDTQPGDTKFIDYRCGIYAMIDKALLELNIDNLAENKSANDSVNGASAKIKI